MENNENKPKIQKNYLKNMPELNPQMTIPNFFVKSQNLCLISVGMYQTMSTN